MEGTTNLPLLYVSFWYSFAYRRLFAYLRAIFIVDFDMFSVKTCLTTLISPWKRDFISYEGLTLQQRFQVWTLNIASRITGFIIKTMTLASYLVSMGFIIIFSLISIIVWPLVPIIAILIIIAGIRML